MIGLPRRGTTWDPHRVVAQRGSIVGKRVARILRQRYEAKARANALSPVSPVRSVDIDMISFSCERDLPEQVLSIRSFLRYAGEPASFTIVSDGTISATSIAILEALAPTVRVVSVAEYADGVAVSEPVQRFADAKAYGRKLIALTAMQPAGRPVGYADSDVLFHRGAAGFVNFVHRERDGLWFLQDCQEALDVRMTSADERYPPLNSGFLVAGHAVDWSDAVRRLGEIGEADAPGYGWTEQTVVHVAYRDSGGLPLPMNECVVALDDQYDWRDEHVGSGTWLRHYVTGTRFKMWLCLRGAVDG